MHDELRCPRCRVTLELRLDGERLELEYDGELELFSLVLPFRYASLDSLFGPPDVRTIPKNPSARIVTCEHCGGDFHPSRGTRNPRFCSKSCSRRHTLAKKHGFNREQYELARDLGRTRRLSLVEAAELLARA